MKLTEEAERVANLLARKHGYIEPLGLGLGLCVARGARALDMIKPGWFGLVDWGTLDIYWCDKCVLEQVFRNDAPPMFGWPGGTWTWAADEVDAAVLDGYRTLRRHGFINSAEHSNDELTDAWRALAQVRTAAATVSA